MKAKIRAEVVLGRDLQPGDLFSTAGPEYWDIAMDKDSIGERVYIRTNAPCPSDRANEPIYRITVSGREGQDQLKLFVWEDVLTDHTAGIMFALAHDTEEARRVIHRDFGDSLGIQGDLKGEPEVVTGAGGFGVRGGG